MYESQMNPDPFPHGYPMLTGYNSSYMAPPDMSAFQQPQIGNDFFQMYMQQMQHLNFPNPASTTFPPMNVQPPEFNSSSDASLNQSSEEGRDSGNDTISPTPSQQTQNLASPAHTVAQPQFPGTPSNMSPPQQMTPMHNMQSLATGVSPYAINNLLSTRKSEELKTENQENHGCDKISKSNNGKKQRTGPYDRSQHLPMNPLPIGYNPLLMNNLAINQYYRRDLCAVCGDNATGFHYSVMSCEGCKGFFRRSVNGSMKYVCQKGAACTFSYENCAANKGTRTRCPACRYKRCIEVGMNKDSVRVKDNDKNRQKSPEHSTLEFRGDIRYLLDAFNSCMSISTPFTSTTHAMTCIKQFVRKVGALNSLFAQNEKEFDHAIEKITFGLVALRAAFSFDPLVFYYSESTRLNSVVDSLRSGIRNTVLTDNGLALLSGIFILQAMKGEGEEIFAVYCQGLRRHLGHTHPQEAGVTERLLMKMGPLFN